MLKTFTLIGACFALAIMIGCSGTAAPTTADVKKSNSAAVNEAKEAAKTIGKDGEGSDEAEGKLDIPAGNKGKDAPRRATPAGTPNQ